MVSLLVTGSAALVGAAGAFLFGGESPRSTVRTLLFRASVVTAAIGVATTVGSLVPPATVGLSSGLAKAGYLGGVGVLAGGALLRGLARYRERDDDATVFTSSGTQTKHATFRRSLDDNGQVVREEVGATTIPEQVGGTDDEDDDAGTSDDGEETANDAPESDPSATDESTDVDADSTFFSDE